MFQKFSKDIILNRFPLKHALDAAATAKIVLRGDIYEGRPLSFKRRMDCVKFYFNANGVNCLHAMLPRTGSHWSELGIALSINLANGGDGEYEFIDSLYIPSDGLHLRRLDWRVPMGRAEEMYRSRLGENSIGEHHYYHTRHPYFRVRSGRLKKMRVAILTRSIVTSLAARYLKHARDPDNLGIIRDGEDVMDWDRFLTQSIEFFNSWGDVLRWHPNCRLYKYEDLLREPVAGHKDLLDFWGFDVPEECIAEAFRRITPDEMKKRIPEHQRERNYRVATPIDDPERWMPKHRLHEIINRLNKELVYNLGYEYNYDTDYSLDQL
jgi:hypothetical protein